MRRSRVRSPSAPPFPPLIRRPPASKDVQPLPPNAYKHRNFCLGVALPWAIAASIVRPAEKFLSISGDGGFLFSAAELETAVRLKANIVHLVWIDGSYDMVGVQEKVK